MCRASHDISQASVGLEVDSSQTDPNTIGAERERRKTRIREMLDPETMRPPAII